MKVAVFHNLPSGGAKRALYGFVKYLAKVGHIIDVFIPSTAEEGFLSLKTFAKEIKVLLVKRSIIGMAKSTIRYFPPMRSYISLADLERTQKMLADMINQGDYEVIFVEQDQYTMSPFILKFLKKPTVYYCPQPSRLHEAMWDKYLAQCGNCKGLAGWAKSIWQWYFAWKIPRIDKENASFARYILTNSYFSREAILRAYGLNSFVCYLGIDNEMFRPLNEKREDFVLSVGAFGIHKGYEFIVNALGQIDEKIRPRLVIVANAVDKRWRQYIEQLSAPKGVNLEIKTLISDAELLKLYNKAKLFVYAPYLEPFGLVPLEAMACGTPVVAVKEGGVRESVLHNETGILTERDERMFAEAIIGLLLDNEKREKLANKAIEAVREFWTLEHAGERLLWHLERAINSYW